MVCGKDSECLASSFCARNQQLVNIKISEGESMNAMDCLCTTFHQRDRLTSEMHISTHHKGKIKFACVNLVKANQYTTITGGACMTACITTKLGMRKRRKKSQNGVVIVKAM